MDSANLTNPGSGIAVSETRMTVSGLAKEALAKFYFVIAGHARWNSEGRRYFLGPDTLLHIPAGHPYSQTEVLKDPTAVYVIQYRPDVLPARLNSQLAALGLFSLDLGTTNINQARVVRSVFQEMLFEQDATQESWETILQSRLYDLAVRSLRLVRRRGRNDLPVFEPGSDSAGRVAHYALRLKSRFFRQETVADAAREVGLSRRHFTELFRKVTGQSWRQYIMGLRLNHAAELLAETGRSVTAVAFESGFEDLSHFYHSFKAAFDCSPVTYREQRQVRLPESPCVCGEPNRPAEACPGFKFRGIKGWFWTAEQYLEEIPVLADLRMNFLMDCYGSLIGRRPGAADGSANEWWKPMSEGQKEQYSEIIRSCQQRRITFCFALHPQLASPRPLDTSSKEDINEFFQHYCWAQSQGVKWFSVCLDDTTWGLHGPKAGGLLHARLVNTLFERLRQRDAEAQFAFCPVICWGDATNREHRDYLGSLAQEMHPEVYVFWNGDSIVTPRVTRVAAESYSRVVNHRLFLWDNYPVNDGSPTLHLGPVSGRASDLCEAVDGYLSNPMCTQNQMNRLPLATCADYAFNPAAYNPARSIGQAILRYGKTSAQQRVLKDLVETYPGFIVAGGGSGTNPVRGKFGSLLSAPQSETTVEAFVSRLQDILLRLRDQFPSQFPATKKTIGDDVLWMKQQLQAERARAVVIRPAYE